MTNVTEIKEKLSWNHEADNWTDAAGVATDKLNEKLNKLINKYIENSDEFNPSELAEIFENNVSKRELAIMQSIDFQKEIKRKIKLNDMLCSFLED